MQPYILGLLLRHFDPRANSTTGQACMYASALVSMIVLQAMVGHHSVVGRKVIGMKMSIAYSALVYRKVKLYFTSVVYNNDENSNVAGRISD